MSISCGSNSLPGVSFWNINDYTHQLSIEGYGVIEPTYMTELSNGNNALSCLYLIQLLLLIVHHIKL